MPTVQPGLTVKSLAEIAWLVSRVGNPLIESQIAPSASAMRDFWQTTRELQRRWDDFLADEPLKMSQDTTRFAEVAAELFSTELLVRVWSTVLGRLDQNSGRDDLTRISRNAVSGLLQIRNRLLSQLLDSPASTGTWGADLDRLRRRCDRWTDLLIGNVCGKDELVTFAFDPERARDFAEDVHDSESFAHPVELLVAAGVRLSFLGQLPEVTLESPAFEKLVKSILASIPVRAFDENGSLREQFLPMRDESPVGRTDDVLLPGISLTALRRRFSN